MKVLKGASMTPAKKKKVDRKEVLLKAAYDLLKLQTESCYVLDLLGELVHYDGADCDGSCLMDDIAIELNLEES